MSSIPTNTYLRRCRMDVAKPQHVNPTLNTGTSVIVTLVLTTALITETPAFYVNPL